MNYNPKFIEKISISELEQEIKEMYEQQYAYGTSIDLPRFWDIRHTVRILKAYDME